MLTDELTHSRAAQRATVHWGGWWIDWNCEGGVGVTVSGGSVGVGKPCWEGFLEVFD